VVVTAPPGQDKAEPAGEATAPLRPVSRRSLMTRVGLGGVTVLVAGTGAVTYRAVTNGVLDPGSGMPYDAWDNWRADPGATGAVATAILATNPHNTQPWVFRISPAGAGTTVDLFSDPTRAIATIDPFDREHQVGLGAALENLVLGARARGYRASVTLLPNGGDRMHVARVTMRPGATPVDSLLYEAIGSRHSARGPYTSAPVPASTLATLSAQAAGLPGVTVRWITTAAKRRALGDLLVNSARAVVDDDQQSRAAFSWFRDTRSDIDRHRDGLTLDGQGLDAVTLTVAKLLPGSSRSAGDEFWLTQTRTVQTATAAAYGVIMVADTDDVGVRINGGRLLQRIHLAATAIGLGLQHMNQITERIDRDLSQGRLAAFAAPLAEILATPGRQALVTFRVGFSRRAPRRSPRRALTAVLW
jgi:hypothetical protein